MGGNFGWKFILADLSSIHQYTSSIKMSTSLHNHVFNKGFRIAAELYAMHYSRITGHLLFGATKSSCRQGSGVNHTT